MPVTAIEGVVENGKIRLREDISLPEDTKVYVVVPESPAGAVFHIRSPRLENPEQAKDFRKQIVEVFDDAKV